jgi:hypothetical protein
MTISTFTGTVALDNATQIDSADDWCEYAAADMQAGLDLVAIGGGRLARQIVLKDSGTLYAVNRNGVERILTSLPAGYVHTGKTRAILPGQSASIIVYW